jgi:DNA-binding CsgD family transcriptional regulator
MTSTRTETDSFGPIEVPADSYWGAQTERSIGNFPFGPREQMPLELIHALGFVKQAAARVNARLGLLDAEVGEAIQQAAGEVASKIEDDAGDSHDVRVRLNSEQRRFSKDLLDLSIPTETDNPHGGKYVVPLREVAQTTLLSSPSSIRRKDLRREIRISANADGRALGDIVSDIKLAEKNINLPAGYDIVQGGDAEELKDMFANMFQALALAELEGYIRLFIEEGEAMRLLIEDCRLWILKQSGAFDESLRIRLIPYMDKLLQSFSAEQPAITQQSAIFPIENQHALMFSQGKSKMVEDLSDRELEVLRLAAEGRTYEEIAGELVVSINTVRTHIKAIYGKLGVNNRTAAVEAARQMDLL